MSYISSGKFGSGETVINLTTQILQTTDLEYTKIPTSEIWYLIYTHTSSQPIHIRLRTPNNQIVQFINDDGSFSSNVNNYTISGMPRIITYLSDITYRVFCMATAGSSIENIYTKDITQSLTDFGNGTWPEGYDSSVAYDTINTGVYSTSDRFYLYSTEESESATTGALIVSGGIGCGGIYTGDEGLRTSNSGLESRIYTDCNGYLNLQSENNGLIITSSNLQFKIQRDDDLNINTMANGTLYTYGNISGLKKIGCKNGLYVNPTGEYNYNALTYSIPTTMGEISVLNGGLNLRSPPNYSFFVYGDQNNPTFTTSTYGGISITSGSLAIDSGSLKLNSDGSTASYIQYETGTLIDSGQKGSISFYFKRYANYNNDNSIEFINLYGSSVNTNIIKLYHYTTGFLKLTVYDVARNVIINDNIGNFSPTEGQWYFISLDFDFTTGSTKLFIDGSQLGSTITTTGTREESRYFKISAPTTATYAVKFLRIYNEENIYTTSYTPPTVTNYNIAQFPVSGGLTLYNSTDNDVYTTLTSRIDGALLVNGGIISGTFDNTIQHAFTNTTESTSATTGAITISGGLGVGKNIYIDGNASVAAADIDTLNIIGSENKDKTVIECDETLDRLKISTYGGLIVEKAFHDQFNGNFMLSNDADYNEGGSSLTAITNGDVSNDSGSVLVGSALNSYIYWTNNSTVDGGTTGCFQVNYTPLYSTAPANTIRILEFVNASGNADRVQFYHLNSGSIKFQIRNTAGDSIADVNFGTWNPTSGTNYNLEINWSNGASRLFIDGTQYGSTDTSDWSARTGTCSRIRSSIIDGGSHYKLNSVRIYNYVQHGSDFEPYGSNTKMIEINDGAVVCRNNLTVPNTITTAYPINGIFYDLDASYIGDFPINVSGLHCVFSYYSGDTIYITFSFPEMPLVTDNVSIISNNSILIPATYRPSSQVIRHFPILAGSASEIGIMTINTDGTWNITPKTTGSFTTETILLEHTFTYYY